MPKILNDTIYHMNIKQLGDKIHLNQDKHQQQKYCAKQPDQIPNNMSVWEGV